MGITVTILNKYCGKIIYVRTRGGLLKHFGIGIEDDQVIHFDKENKNDTAKIIKSSIKEFLEFSIDHRIYTPWLEVEFPPEKVIARAKQCLGKDFEGYSFFNNNCEHFARWCAYGIKTSSQSPTSDEEGIEFKILNTVGDKCSEGFDHLDHITFEVVAPVIEDVIDGVSNIKHKIEYSELWYKVKRFFGK